MTGFMTAVKDMDKSKGLDLILHTPGGNPMATESIVSYLRSLFDINIRVIVPHLAMSAGTMMACAGKEIIMGKQSSLGPIDPQFNGVPAFNVKRLFESAKDDLAMNPDNLSYWSLQFNGLTETILYDCMNAIDLSTELVSAWLSTGMFKNKKADKTIQAIVQNLNQNEQSKNHARHFNKELCKKFGLKITDLEDDNELQDAVLSVHHSYIVLMQNTSIVKIIENHLEKAYLIQQNAPTIMG